MRADAAAVQAVVEVEAAAASTGLAKKRLDIHILFQFYLRFIKSVAFFLLFSYSFLISVGLICILFLFFIFYSFRRFLPIYLLNDLPFEFGLLN